MEHASADSAESPMLSEALKELDDPAAPISHALKHYAASRIYQAIESCFAHWENVPDLCHADLYFDYLNTLEEAQNRRDFLLATQGYLARLQNAHTFFIDFMLQKNASFGFWARPLPASAAEPHNQVWTVYDTTRADLHLEDVIKEVNALPADEFFSHYTRFVSASKPEAATYNLLRGYSFLFPDQLTLTLADSRKLLISRKEATNPSLHQNRVELDTSGQHPRLLIGSFAKPEFEEQALTFLSQLDNHSPLILDLRGNGGGDTPMRLMKKLCLEPIPIWQERTPQFTALEKAQQGLAAFQNGKLSAHHKQPNAQTTIMQQLTNGETIPVDPEPFQGQLIVLIDVGSCSATEDLLIPLKHSGRATIIGEASAGSTGQPYFEAPLPHTQLMVSTKRTAFPDGTQFEGIGIQPDHPVIPTAEDIQQGNDPALALAQQLLGNIVTA
ncbi:S41 family peptidase [Pseudovibrio denitrificans]|uniref:S41 family peptidase n=1 Tax=Pseudovibrio denitrificans TaxID=258256 RepID=UPI0039BF14B1